MRMRRFGAVTGSTCLLPDASPTSAFAANLEVNCQVGNPPSGPHHENEGIKLNVKDVINFNQHVPGPSGHFGENIFIKQ